jgi:hypothetical protein
MSIVVCDERETLWAPRFVTTERKLRVLHPSNIFGVFNER